MKPTAGRYCPVLHHLALTRTTLTGVTSSGTDQDDIDRCDRPTWSYQLVLTSDTDRCDIIWHWPGRHWPVWHHLALTRMTLTGVTDRHEVINRHWPGRHWLVWHHLALISDTHRCDIIWHWPATLTGVTSSGTDQDDIDRCDRRLTKGCDWSTWSQHWAGTDQGSCRFFRTTMNGVTDRQTPYMKPTQYAPNTKGDRQCDCSMV